MDILPTFSKSDDRLFSYFAKETIISFFENRGPHDPNPEKSTWMLLGLITIVGTEPLKVLLRRNIGKLSLSLPRLITAAFLYFLWALLIYALIASNEFEGHESSFWVGPSALWAVIVFYILFGLGIIILGIIEYTKANTQYNKNPNNFKKHLHRGDSMLFDVQANSSPAKVWVWREPVMCFVSGIILTVINPFLGLPILGTSISFWLNEYFQVNNVWNIVDQKVANAQMRIAYKKPYNEDGEDFPIVRSNS